MGGPVSGLPGAESVMGGPVSGLPEVQPVMGGPVIFGVRHLSPAGAWHLRRLLDEIKPMLVLVESPSDLTDQIPYLTREETKPPVAVLAYTKEAPVRSVLYPLAEYSPEYQAVLWAHDHGAQCRFMDLPSDVFLTLGQAARSSTEGEEAGFDVYKALDRQTGEDGHETFWERTLEHGLARDGYLRGAAAFGRELRALTEGRGTDWPEILVREAYMRRQIENAVEEGRSRGFGPERIVAVTGAYHVEGLKTGPVMTDEEIKALPRQAAGRTLMPYSYYRLSSRSGYGAGNQAPAYYSLLWEELNRKEPGWAARSYLTRIARYQREQGTFVSPAQVIEAVRLSGSLAGMRGGIGRGIGGEMGGGNAPALRDLRDAAVTCLGEGSLSAVSRAIADTEIGTAIGSLPEGVSQTSLQEDFYRNLRELKLEKYRALTAQDLALDLRENRMVKSEKAAFLDLERSFFLHRLRVLGVSFGQNQKVSQDNATWAERWILKWTPEAEIELVESALKGDTILWAASFQMKERVEEAENLAQIARVIEDAFTCGMAKDLEYATRALQAMAVDAAALEDLAAAAGRLSMVIQYGSLRRLDPAPLEPILKQIFLRSCLILPGACVCDDGGAKVTGKAVNGLNSAALAHEFLDTQLWLDTLRQVSERDDLNTRLSGLAAAILLERGVMDSQRLDLEVHRRLSRGVPAELGAGWFEGLAMKNRYALIARLSLWKSLDSYLEGLDDQEFKRALVFLRRAFADFTAGEKDDIAQNLGELWNLNGSQVSETVNAPLTEEDQEMLAGLDDFDFDI